MFEFFSSGSVFFFCFWVFKTWYFIGVTFCTASCIFVFVFVALNFLNTLCFTIIRLDVALLLARIKTASFCFLLSNLSGFPFSFHTNRKLSVQFKPLWVCRPAVWTRAVRFKHAAFESNALTWQVFSCGMKICSVFCSFFTWEPKNYRHSIQILKHSVLTWC